MIDWPALVSAPNPLVEILIKVTVLLAIAWGLHGVAARFNPRWRVLIWRAAVVGIVLMPVLTLWGPHFKLPIISRTPTWTNPQSADPVASQSSPASPTLGPIPPAPVIRQLASIEPVLSQSLPPARRRPTPSDWIFLGWSMVAMILMARQVAGWAWVRGIASRSRRAPEPALEQMTCIAAELGCRRRADLRVSSQTAYPFLAGVFRPVIVLPHRMLATDYQADLPAILAHELAHLRSGDLVWMGILKWLRATLWFHPLLWRAPQAHEAACEQVSDAVAYSQTLARVALELAAPTRPAAAVPMARTPQVRRRLARLKRGLGANGISRTWATACVLLAAVFLTGLCSLKLIYAHNESSDLNADVKAEIVTQPELDVSEMLDIPITIKTDREMKLGEFMRTLSQATPATLRYEILAGADVMVQADKAAPVFLDTDLG